MLTVFSYRLLENINLFALNKSNLVCRRCQKDGHQPSPLHLQRLSAGRGLSSREPRDSGKQIKHANEGNTC